MGQGAKTKGYIKVDATGETLSFQYNPSGISDSQAFNYAVISSPCSYYPKFQYVGTGERTFSLPLFLYGTKGEPQKYIDFIEKLKATQRFEMPKVILVAMGRDVRKCIVTSIARDILDYNEDLSIRSANITLALTEV